MLCSMLSENRPRAMKNIMKKPTSDCRFPKDERVIKKGGQVKLVVVLILLS